MFRSCDQNDKSIGLAFWFGRSCALTWLSKNITELFAVFAQPLEVLQVHLLLHRSVSEPRKANKGVYQH